MLCFQVDPNYICKNPTVKVIYEPIDYGRIQTYLNVGYQTESNKMNNYPCFHLNNECGASVECAIGNQINNGSFYFTNGEV